MSALDTDLFLALNAGASPSPAIAFFAVAVTRYAILAVPILILVLWFRGPRRRRLLAFALVLGLVIALAASFLIGLVAFRPRPFMAGLGSALVDHRPNGSFPSNHALVFAVCALVLALVRHYGLAVATLLLGILVGWSRIYVGVHYPSDVVGAIVVAIPAALIALALTARYGDAAVGAAERLQQRLGLRSAGPARR